MPYIFSVVKADDLTGPAPENVNIGLFIIPDDVVGEGIVSQLGTMVADVLVSGENAERFGRQFLQDSVVST